MIRPEILIVSHDIVAAQMAGPGIRYRGLARVLARSFNVTLAVPGDSDLGDEPFALWPYRRDEWATLAPAAHRARVIIAPGDSLADFAALEGLPGPLVVDGYDPHTLETLAMWRGEAPAFQDVQHGARLEILRRQCRAADFLICASERQRDWWLGQLEQAGRINPRTYGADPSLRSLVDVVSFGLPAEPPQARRPVIRGVWPGVGAGDELLLWGGGLWQWLDPLTALRAVRRLVDGGRDRVRLVFPGTRHPNPNVPHMPMREQAMALAEELGLAGVHVFFGDWVPFQDWPSALLEADVGLSLHPDTVEARLAFRCRVLDYVWAGLSSVLTRGDATAELVAGRGLGTLVDFGDDAAVADGIAALLDHPLPEARFEAARRELTWEQAAGPLVSFCQRPHRAADRESGSAIRPGAPARATSGAVTRRKEDERGTAMPKPTSNISVIVLTWNGQAYIVDCLEALLAQDPAPREVIVVDNASTDGTPDLVAERFPQVTLTRNERNLGFAAGNNVGLRTATGQILVLLNQDTKVQPGFLAAMAEAMEEPGVGLAGCKLLYPDGTIQHAGGFVYGPRGETEHVGRGAPDDGQFDESAEPDFVTAAAVAISRACLAEIGPLDEAFAPAYYEDVDWCYRARAAGWRVVYQPRAIVTHYERASADRASHSHMMSVQYGRVRLLLKHWPLERLLEEWRPAEAAWAADLPRVTWLMTARGAYLQALLDLPGILAFRHSSPQEARALADLLGDLRAAAMASLEALSRAPSLAAVPPVAPPPASEPPASEPEQPQPVPGQPAATPPPGPAGPLAGLPRLRASLRRLWAGIRHLNVLPDLVRQVRQHDETLAAQGQSLSEQSQALAQHSQILAQHGQAHVRQGELLGWTSRRVDGLETRSTAQGEALAGQARDVAQNIRELTVIAELLAHLEATRGEEQNDG